MIEPRTLKGFRDYLPEAMIPREWLIETARRVYRSYGFSPIDTPALEYQEILIGKGGDETDKQLYRFADPGGRAGGDAVRSDGAAGPLRRPAYGRAGHAVQALSHRHGLAGREAAARPLPRIHAVRFRHDRHALARRRYRNGAGHPRFAAGPRLRRISRSTSTTGWCSTACWNGSAWPIVRSAVLRAIDKLPKIGPGRRRRGNARNGRHDRRAMRAMCCGWPNCRTRQPASGATTRSSKNSARSWPAANGARRAWLGWPSCWRR